MASSSAASLPFLCTFYLEYRRRVSTVGGSGDILFNYGPGTQYPRVSGAKKEKVAAKLFILFSSSVGGMWVWFPNKENKRSLTPVWICARVWFLCREYGLLFFCNFQDIRRVEDGDRKIEIPLRQYFSRHKKGTRWKASRTHSYNSTCCSTSISQYHAVTTWVDYRGRGTSKKGTQIERNWNLNENGWANDKRVRTIEAKIETVKLNKGEIPFTQIKKKGKKPWKVLIPPLKKTFFNALLESKKEE